MSNTAFIHHFSIAAPAGVIEDVVDFYRYNSDLVAETIAVFSRAV